MAELTYQYEFRSIDRHRPDQWIPFTVEFDGNLRTADVEFLKEYAKGNYPRYQVRYRAILKSDWEDYTEG